MSPLLSRRQPMIPLTNIPAVQRSSQALVLKRPERHIQLQQRAFTAAATPIDVSNRTEAQRLKKLRQPWQEEAWEYRDAIGELRYATTYLGNSARRMVLVPSAYVPNELNPVPLEQIEDCPPGVLASANDALERLAVGGAVALGGMLRDITENFEVAGECYLVGMEVEGEETWEIRSISEIGIDGDGKVVLKDVENYGNSSGYGVGEPLPANAYIARLWWPHPRRKAFADSPFKAILDVCEELLILSRDIRASGRSRLANNGILLVPDSLTVIRADVEDDANDAETGDPFLQQLIAAAMAAIQDEGSASAVLPLVARGPADALAAVRQVVISRPDSPNADKRQELITRMATGLDLPSEVLTGKADLNHWTSWQVSDDTFRHHIEPIVMVETDALTLGYYRPELKAREVPEEWLNRIVLWYDPTNLVTKPDRTQDAMNAFDRIVLSSAALRDYMGFEETDAPEPAEILLRLASKAQLDPTVAAQIIKSLDQTIDTTGVSSTPSIQLLRPGPGQARTPEQPVEQPPEEQAGPAALPASASMAERVILQLLRGGDDFGGAGSGRYPKGSGKGKTPSDHEPGGAAPGGESPVGAGKSESEKIGKVGVGSRNDLNDGVASRKELAHARSVAQSKYDALPEPTEADRIRAAEKHAKSKRAGGDDRPGSKQRKANRQALLKQFGDGEKAPCVCCGRNVTESTMSLDRIVPGSHGGSYAQYNLVPMDYDCNRIRSNSDFTDMKWVKKKSKSRI